MKRAILLILFLSSFNLFTQDLEKILDNEVNENSNIPTTATFKSTRLQNGHTVERTNKGELELRIHHRFGKISGGIDEFFGLDESSSLISLEYGVTDWLMIGIGRATIDKTVNAFAKFTLFRQSTGARAFPLTISYLAQSSIITAKKGESDPYNDNINRISYFHQLLIANKINPNLSLQFMPGFLHRNLVEEPNNNDLFVLGIGGRYKFSKWVAICGEYYYLPIKDVIGGNEFDNAYSVGVDIDTGGHVFQLLVSSSPYLLENQFLSRSNGKILDGSVYIGFNIMRTFSLFDN